MNVEKAMYVSVTIFGIIGTMALVDQTRKIWRNRSAKSVSGTAVIIFTTLFISFLIYGSQISSGSMMFHGGLRALFWIPILIGFFLYGSSDSRHWIFLGLCMVMLMAMSLDGLSPYVFGALSVMSVWFSLVQAHAIMKNRARGMVSVSNQIVPCLSASVWVAYAVYRKDNALAISTAFSASAYLFVIAAWVKYPNPKTLQPAT